MRRGDEIHEQPDARGRWTAGEEGREQIEGVAAVVGEAIDEPSGFKILRHVPKRLQREAASLERPCMQRVAAAGEMAADFDLLDAAPGAKPLEKCAGGSGGRGAGIRGAARSAGLSGMPRAAR